MPKSDKDWLDSIGAVPLAPADASRGTPESPPTPEESGQFRQSNRQFGLDAIPVGGRAIGGIAGTLAGGIPGGIRGATIGGMGGEAIRQIASPFVLGPEAAQSSVRDALMGIGASGVQGGLEEVAGVPLALASRGLSQSLMQGALKPSRSQIQDAMRAGSRRTGRTVTPEDVNIARSARRLKVAPGRVSPLAQPGSVKIGGVVQTEAQALNDALDAAGKDGTTFTIQDATKHIGALRVKLARHPRASKMLNTLDKRLKELVTDQRLPGKPGRQGKLKRFTPAEFNEFKREWQDIARTLFENPTKRGGLDQQMAQQLSRGARRELEGIPGKGPRIAEQNQRLSELFPLQEAIRNAEIAMAQGSGASLPILPAAVTSLAIPAAIRNRGMVGSAALRFDQLAPLLQQAGILGSGALGTQDALIEALRAAAESDR